MVEMLYMGVSQYGSHSPHEDVEHLKCGACIYATDSLIVINLHSHTWCTATAVDNEALDGTFTISLFHRTELNSATHL